MQSISTMPYPITSTMTKTEPLFPPFRFSHWKAVDDRVRGGSSVSHLDPVDLHLSSASATSSATSSAYPSGDDVSEEKEKKGKGPVAARFWGNLDIKTLGGAGFASQAYFYGPFPLDLNRVKYGGIALSVLPHSTQSASTPSTQSPSTVTENENDNENAKPHLPDTFTLVLKTTPTAHIPKHPRNPAPPRAASLTYEVSFSAPPALTGNSKNHGKSTQHTFAWDEFKAFYRGKEIKEGEERWVALDSTTIYEISLMCRSNFGEQEGDFSLVVQDISAWVKSDVAESKGWWGRAWSWSWSWYSGLVSWFRTVMGWQRIRLDDDQDEKAGLLV